MGDNTIQNSAFTAAGSLNGTYNLANMTIDTNGKITSLSSGLSSNNTYTGTNTFNNTLTLNSGSRYYNTTNYTEFLQTGTQLTIKPISNNGSLALFSTNSTGVQTQQLLIDNSGVNIYGTMTFYANPTTQFSTINQTSATLIIQNPTTSGTYNPASTAGTIGIIGLKDQTTDNVIFTLYGNISWR